MCAVQLERPNIHATTLYRLLLLCKIDKKATIQCSTWNGSDVKAIKLFCSGYICFGIVRHLIQIRSDEVSYDTETYVTATKYFNCLDSYY